MSRRTTNDVLLRRSLRDNHTDNLRECQRKGRKGETEGGGGGGRETGGEGQGKKRGEGRIVRY